MSNHVFKLTVAYVLAIAAGCGTTSSSPNPTDSTSSSTTSAGLTSSAPTQGSTALTSGPVSSVTSDTQLPGTTSVPSSSGPVSTGPGATSTPETTATPSNPTGSSSSTSPTGPVITSSGETSEPTTETGGSELEWLPSWGTTVQRTELKNIPNNGADPKTNWPDKTIRQFVWPTFSGGQIRIRLNNEKGEAALDVQKLHIAKAKTAADPGNSSGQIDTATDTAVTFGGMPNVTIPAGMAVWSDAVDFPLEEIKLTAVTMHLGASVPTGVTGHPGARTTSYIATGDAVASEALNGATTIDRWYFIETIEVMAPKDAYAIAAFGDSITDGYGILNKFERWPDYLTLRLKEDPVLGPKRSVLNFGMGANNLTKDSTEENNASIVTQDSGLKRFDRDVISSTKIKWVIIMEGVNDMTYSNVAAQPLIDAYSSMITKAHTKGILAYGSPITPCNAGLCPAERVAVNSWIRTSGEYDAVIDFAEVLSTSDNVWNTTYKNDDLHPNSAGYKAMADSIDLALFTNIAP